MENFTTKNQRELIIILLLTLLTRLPWLLMIPHAEAPDESMHCWVINYINDHMLLPDCQSVTQNGAQASYGPVPPFGYLPHIILLKLIPTNISGQLHLIITRLGSLFASLVVIFVAWWTGRKLFQNNNLAALSLPLLIIFHPQFVFVSSYANNDITAAAVASGVLMILIRCISKGLKTHLFALFFLLTWLILSKYSACSIFLATCLFLPLVVYLRQEKVKKQMLFLLALFLGILSLTGLWFLRNYSQFDGDITGVNTMNAIWATAYHHQLNPLTTPFTIIFASRFWRMLFFSFWGWFGYMTHSLPRTIYYGYLVFVLLAIVLSISNWRSIKKNTDIATSLIWFLFALCILLNLASCIYGSITQIAGAQGRYLFPCEIPIIAMLTGGLISGHKKWSSYLLSAFLAFNVIAYVFSTFYVYKLYWHV